MSREKQIEELTMDICRSRGVAPNALCCRQSKTCLYREIAWSLYNAGYRKQSGADANIAKTTGEWEKRVFIIFDSKKLGYRCSECNTTWDAPTPYCPNCGAKMKGGAE